MLKIKPWVLIIVALVAILSFVLVSNHYYKRENRKLLKDSVMKEAVIETIKEDNSILQEDKKIADEVMTDVITKIEESDQTEAVIKGGLVSKIERIRSEQKSRNDGKPKPPPPALTEEDKKISEARIDAIWQHYCLTVDNKAPECQNLNKEDK